MQYIKLENFALIQAGMKINTIELDFRKTTNIINLIIGNNGTGKTALISNFHPFAFLGHLEARDDSDLIIPELDGKKTVIFTTKKHEYYIEHIYKWAGEGKTRMVKSYIQKDGVELNSSGLVKSFLGIVQTEFEIDTNFLKLIRLGGNVTNFVELTSAGRITFISKLLDAISVYVKGNKLMRERSTELTANLKSAVAKMERLNVSDVSLLQEEVRRKEKLIRDTRELRDENIQSFYSYAGKMDQGRMSSVEADLDSCGNVLDSLRRELDQVPRPTRVHSEFGDRPTAMYNQQIATLDEQRMQLVATIGQCSSTIGGVEASLEKVQKMIDGTASARDLRDLNEYIELLRGKVAHYESQNNAIKPALSIAELTADVDKINMMIFQIQNVLNLEPYAVQYFCKKYEEFDGDLNALDEYSKAKSKELHRKLDQFDASIGHSALRSMNLVMFTPRGCEVYPKCPYYQYYMSGLEATDSTKRATAQAELSAVEDMSGILNAMYTVKKLMSMLSDVKRYKLTFDKILRFMLTGDENDFVDRAQIQSLKEEIEEFDEYAANKQKLKEKESELAIMLAKTNQRTREELEEELRNLEAERDTAQAKKNELYEQVTELNKQIQEWKDMIEDYNVSVRYESETRRIKDAIALEESRLAQLTELNREKMEFLERQREFQAKLDDFNAKIETLDNEIKEDQMKEITYRELSREIEQIKDRYDYVTLIKEATSNSEGIPLVHIKLYCRALCTIANAIIKELYTGDFKLLDFKVKENSFTIPYYTKGFTVKDIKDASQAEASVAKLAISFAILSQFVTKYNIILLDEIDGPMHRVNKERFFAALEGQLDRLKCEQAFIITQSAMFNDYPVNLICTDPDYKTFIPKNATVVFQR
jgi:DNA repair exonuclease SbcCD ATPase subunit